MQIHDGAGKGNGAKVDAYNRLSTYATTIKEVADISTRMENAFSITTELLTFNSTNEHPGLGIKNTNSTLYLYFSSIIYSYNGGSTNFNRSMVKKVYRNPPAPTSRYTECCTSNMNMGSNNTADWTVYSGDESAGDGMEIDLSNTENFSTSIVGKGSLTLQDIEGVVLPFNSTVLFSFTPEEVGTAAISIKMYFNHARVVA